MPRPRRHSPNEAIHNASTLKPTGRLVRRAAVAGEIQSKLHRLICLCWWSCTSSARRWAACWSVVDEMKPSRPSASRKSSMSGVSVYEGTHDVRWYYIACRCVECNLVGVFADWKCEAGDAATFLAKA